MNDDPKKRISIIIVYNNSEKLEEAKSWIGKQSAAADIEMIALDNQENRYASAAMALNYGAECAQGDFLVFMHQDVYLWDLNAIGTILDYLEGHPRDIAGAAGKSTGQEIISDIYETKEGLRKYDRTLGTCIEVAALDECLIAMTKERWSELRFDEVCCDHWHCYAMDICMNNTLHGGKNVVLPLEVCHESTGNPWTDGFRNTIGNLVKKYRHTQIEHISGTCIDIACSWRGYLVYRTREYVRDTVDKLDLLEYCRGWKKHHGTRKR